MTQGREETQGYGRDILTGNRDFGEGKESVSMLPQRREEAGYLPPTHGCAHELSHSRDITSLAHHACPLASQPWSPAEPENASGRDMGSLWPRESCPRKRGLGLPVHLLRYHRALLTGENLRQHWVMLQSLEKHQGGVGCARIP